MTDSDKNFVGSIPEIYDTYLVPLIFETYARDLAKRVTTLDPASVLETAAGSGVVARALAPTLSDERIRRRRYRCRRHRIAKVHHFVMRSKLETPTFLIALPNARQVRFRIALEPALSKPRFVTMSFLHCAETSFRNTTKLKTLSLRCSDNYLASRSTLATLTMVLVISPLVASCLPIFTRDLTLFI